MRKDNDCGGTVTDAELRHEVEKTKKFTPAANIGTSHHRHGETGTY
jgi:hypothetical protein